MWEDRESWLPYVLAITHLFFSSIFRCQVGAGLENLEAIIMANLDSRPDFVLNTDT